MPGIEVGDDLGTARELLVPAKQERTAHWTHSMSSAARLLFLFSHGALVLSVSTSLGRFSQSSWWLVFLPVWIGNALCAVLLVTSWFASCPYIKLCLAQRSQRLGSHNPSILTEILPQIILAFLGLLFLILIFLGEYALCSYLDSEQHGHPYSLAPSVILLVSISLVAICHGTLLVDDSPLFIAVGFGVLASVVIFALTRRAEPRSQAWSLLPAALAVAGLFVSNVRRFKVTFCILTREERLLRLGELVALAVLLFSTLAIYWDVGSAPLLNARAHGFVAGTSVCAVAALRGRMCMLEFWQPVDERMHSMWREAMRGGCAGEVQIALRSPEPLLM